MAIGGRTTKFCLILFLSFHSGKDVAAALVTMPKNQAAACCHQCGFKHGCPVGVKCNQDFNVSAPGSSQLPGMNVCARDFDSQLKAGQQHIVPNGRAHSTDEHYC